MEHKIVNTRNGSSIEGRSGADVAASGGRSRTSKHTPTPWENNCFLVTASNGREVTHTGILGRRRSSWPDQSGGDEDEANAEFIVRACNAHDDLLAACKEAELLMHAGISLGMEQDTQDSENAQQCGDILKRINAAIAKAEQQQ